jgi:hypothetical protein
VWSQVGVHVDHAVDVRGYAHCGVEHRPNFADSAPIVADVDGDGTPEMVVVGNVYNCGTSPYTSLYHMPFVLKLDRTRWSGSGFDWTAIPSPPGGSSPRSEDYDVIETALPNPVAADLDGDGRLEILFPSYDGRLHAYWLDKTEHGSWPFTVPSTGVGGDTFRFASEPVVADLDGDGQAEVIVASWPRKGTGLVGHLHVLSSMGVELHRVALPAPAIGKTWNGGLGAPTLANVDADADLEVVVGTSGSGVVAYELPGSAGARVLWGTGRGSYRRTGAAPDEGPPPTLTIDDVSVAEGDAGVAAATFTLSLSAPSGRTVRVGAATADGTATAGSDYRAGAWTVEIPPGAVSGTVRVDVFGDRVHEPDETFSVVLSSPVNAALGDTHATGRILNDDAPGLSIADLDAVEPPSGSRDAVFTVTLSPPSGSPVSVAYATTALTATAGDDFTPVSGTLVFDPGVTALPVAVPVLADALAEGMETFRVDLSAPSGAAIAWGQGTGRIHDPGNFFSLTPCRVLDTRDPAGPWGGPALAANQSRSFTLAGRCAIPASARAVSVNLTVTQPWAQGNLRLHPADQPVPLASSLNYVAGQTRANNAVVGLSQAGALAVRCTQAAGTAHAVLDVTGYFE